MRTRLPHVLRRFAVIGGICVLALASGAVGAYASHSFTDVPETNPFHDEIDWLAAKGITTGFSDGTYRPGNPVTRQAMAAFLQRLASGSPLEWEPNNTIAAADIFPMTDVFPNWSQGIAMGQLLSTDYDYWRVTAPGGGYISATTDGLECSNQNRSNIDVVLFDANGNEFPADDTNDVYGFFCGSLYAQPVPAGDYFVRVDSPGNVPWYSLNILVTNYES